ncbi:MAG: hypothetical protein WCI74_20285, partial [Actinomycetes bacterium]
MTELVAAAAATGEPLIVQAGTGTGKSLAYLCGGVGAGARSVISTATRQLSDQLLASDIPLVSAVAESVIGQELTAVALKGRANYLCLAKVNELRELDAQAPPTDIALDLGIELPPASVAAASDGPAGSMRPSPADVAALNEVLEWAEQDLLSGDRSGAPAVSDRVWYQVSTDAAGCPGARNCLFGQECLAEAARAAAREADIVVINHALLAADLVSPGPLFDDRDLIVVDEVQELEGYLSSAWGHEIFAGAVERICLNAARRVPRDREAALTVAQAVLADSAAVVAALRDIEGRRWDDDLPATIDGPLEALRQHTVGLSAALERIAKEAGDPEVTNGVQSARGQLAELIESVEAVRTKDRDVVRWSDAGRDGNPGVIRSAPLQVGRRFRE